MENNRVWVHLLTLSKNASQYEDIYLQNKAKVLVPLEKIIKKSETQISFQVKNDHQKVDITKVYISNLLKWFSHHFFHWVEQLNCELCNGVTVVKAVPKFSTGNRLFYCSQCAHETMFPVYNDVESLLTIRRGLEKEWAKLFMLFCRTFRFTARYVEDLYDHAWVEVYSSTQNRWLHCDPYQERMDCPLFYEKVWSQKFDYIFAASYEEIQDVTWRYTNNHESVLKRRNLVDEIKLVMTLCDINRARQQHLSPKHRKYLLKRRIEELVEMLRVPTPADGKLNFFDWRLEKKECASERNKSLDNSENHVKT